MKLLAILLLAVAPTLPTPLAPSDYFNPADLAAGSLVCPTRTSSIISSIDEGMLSSQWAAANEPSLYKSSRDSSWTAIRVIRFTLISQFMQPTVVRVEQSSNGHWRLHVKQTVGTWDRPTGIAHELERDLTADEAAALTKALDAADLLHAQSGNCSIGLDGDDLFFEIASPGLYKYVARPSGPVSVLSLTLLKFVPWDE